MFLDCNVYIHWLTINFSYSYSPDMGNLEKIVEKIAFKMKLHQGMEDEYKKRHDEIWPELLDLLVQAGITDYSIFHDEDTNILFAVMWRKKTTKKWNI